MTERAPHASKPEASPESASELSSSASASSGLVRSVSAETPPAARRSAEAAKLELAWRIAAVIFLVFAIGAAVADRLHPAIAATFAAKETTPGTAISLDDARLLQPVTASASGFGLSQILPPGPIEVPGRGGELLVRLRVARGECRALVARVGGSCAGRPQPLPMPEGLGITAPNGELETRLEMTPAEQALLGQNSEEEARSGPRREWSLTENAEETTVTLRCLQPVSLTLTLLPAHAHPTCIPDGPFFRLALRNRRPYAPNLAFVGTRDFQTVLAASRVEVKVDKGLLSFGDVRRRVGGVEPTVVALRGGEPIDMRLAAPRSVAAAAPTFSSAETTSATVEDEDAIPSLLERDSTAESVLYGAIVALFLAALTCYLRALIANLTKEP